jgi:transcriptional regulator with XRE-family HTH domain
MANEILILEGLTEGQRVRFIRLSKKFRQIDLASQANVNPIDITRLEHDRWVRPTRRERILRVLGLLEDENETTN